MSKTACLISLATLLLFTSEPPACAARERCNRCYGSGRCRTCGGDGELSSCSACSGSGRLQDRSIADDSVSYRSCSSCRGSGRKLCYDCRKTGRCKHCVGGYRYASASRQPFLDSASSLGNSTARARRLARFRSAVQRHHVRRGGQLGIEIEVDVDIFGAQGEPIWVSVYFKDSAGKSLRDRDGKYVDATGHVWTGEQMEMPSYHSRWSELKLFLPYEQLEVRVAGQRTYEFDVQVQTDDGELLGQTNSQLFYYEP